VSNHISVRISQPITTINNMDSGFTIPKKKNKEGEGSPNAEEEEEPPVKRGRGRPPSRKKACVDDDKSKDGGESSEPPAKRGRGRPSRKARVDDEKMSSPEWEAISKLLTHFLQRADCGK